jgi:mannose-6-phosphate isomerase-like protein (cupin superfamily)
MQVHRRRLASPARSLARYDVRHGDGHTATGRSDRVDHRAMSQPVRRVVTGHDSRGRAVFVSDSLVEPVVTALSPSTAFHQVWGGDGPPTFPDDGTQPVVTTYFPPVGGFRFGLFTLPPANEPRPGPEVDIADALAELGAALPGLFDYNEALNPGMHTTPTIDFEVVLAGEVVLELDDGATVQLRLGDTVVQNGTRHRWSNPGDVPATLAVFICGAHHRGIG